MVEYLQISYNSIMKNPKILLGDKANRLGEIKYEYCRLCKITNEGL